MNKRLLAAVLGLGKSGRSACHYLLKKGYAVQAADDSAAAACPDGVEKVLPEALCRHLSQFLVVSPGIKLSHPVVQRAKAHGVPIVCDVELAFQDASKPPFLAITGTNGKTTTALLTCHMLRQAQKKVAVAGNIGVPVLDLLEDKNDQLVLEISSYQLQMLHTKAISNALITNISPNHLDHHACYDEYVACKQHMAFCLKEGGRLYVQEKAFCQFSWPAKPFTFGFNPSCDVSSDGLHVYRFQKKEIAIPETLVGHQSHDAENFLAAYALSRECDVAPDICVEAYSSFVKPPHRIQFVREVDGVSYYDDSKATNIEAVRCALKTFSKPVVLIAGGVHKGFGYHAWKEPFKQKVRKLVLIGQAAGSIEHDLDGTLPITRADTLEEAVQQAKNAAQNGDVILLSPGCSSFDMFKSYEDRGNKFQEIVNRIK